MKELIIKAFASNKYNVSTSSYNGNSSDPLWRTDIFYSYLICDLGKLCSISEIEIHLENRCAYFISASEDMTTWSDIYDTGREKENNKVLFHTSITSRFIKITFRYAETGKDFALMSLHVYGNEERKYTRTSDNRLCSDITESKGFIFRKFNDLTTAWSPMIGEAKENGSYLKLSDVNTDTDKMQILLGFPFNDRKLPKRLEAEIELRIDSLDGELIAKNSFFRQWMEWTHFIFDVKRIAGRHDVFLILKKLDEKQSLEFCFLGSYKNYAMPTPSPAPATYRHATGKSRIYFGLLHSHTTLSDGEGTPDIAFKYARNVAGLDFMGITEHGNLMDGFSPADSRKLKDLKLASIANTEEGKFVALYGTETTWYNQFGHINIYEEDLFFSASEIKYNAIDTYYETIKKYPNSINQWNHPWSCGNRHLDHFRPYDDELDKVLFLIEMNPYEDPSNHGMNFYIEALDEGWHVSPCGSQDNHKSDWGTMNNLRTAIMSEKLTHDALMNAIRINRVYFTSAPNLEVRLQINGFPMGSRIVETNAYNIEVSLDNSKGKSDLSLLEIITEGGKILDKGKLKGRAMHYSTRITVSYRYFFIRAELEDGTFAVSSPVWIEK